MRKSRTRRDAFLASATERVPRVARLERATEPNRLRGGLSGIKDKLFPAPRQSEGVRAVCVRKVYNLFNLDRDHFIVNESICLSCIECGPYVCRDRLIVGTAGVPGGKRARAGHECIRPRTRRLVQIPAARWRLPKSRRFKSTTAPAGPKSDAGRQ
jgi:hypothetical protein